MRFRVRKAMTVHYNECFAQKWVEHLSPIEWRNTVTLRFIDVSASRVEPAGCRLDPDVVKGWARRIGEGVPIPPPVGSVTERGTYYLHDGNHRIAALAEALEDTETVRIGVVTPIAGYRFERLRQQNYYTYALLTTPKRALVQAAGACLGSALAVLFAATIGASALISVFIVVSVIWAARQAGFVAGALTASVGIVLLAYFVFPPLGSLQVDGWAALAELIFLPLPALWIAKVRGNVGAFASLRQRLQSLAGPWRSGRG
jgi:hypothetical protein